MARIIRCDICRSDVSMDNAAAGDWKNVDIQRIFGGEIEYSCELCDRCAAKLINTIKANIKSFDCEIGGRG